MPPQGRLGDKSQIPADAHGCPGCPHPAIGPAIDGSPNVNVNSRPALRVGDHGMHAACCGPNTWTASAGSGTVNINEGYRATFGSVDAPMGGVKQSGLGRRNGPEGLLRYAESHNVADNTGLLTLPTTGREWAKMITPMLLLLRIEKAIRRR